VRGNQDVDRLRLVRACQGANKPGDARSQLGGGSRGDRRHFALEQFDFAGDPAEDHYIERGMAIGVIQKVDYSVRGDRIRIISARKATTHEQRQYYRSQKAD